MQNSPLHNATKNENLEMVNLLLANGAKTDLLNDENFTPLNMCVQYNGNVEIARLLLKKDSSVVNIPDIYQYTPLHSAAYRGYLEMTKLLLQYGADKYLRTYNKQTPAQLARQKNHKELAHYFTSFI